MYPRYNIPRKKKPSILKVTILVLAGLVVLVGVLELTNATHFFHARHAELTASPATKGIPGSEASKTDSTNKGNQATTSTGDNQSNQNTDTNVYLKEPSGVFVSNHHPNLSGSPAPNTINSVCNTTSGATCQIIFTKGDDVKTLPTQMTDKGGSTYWNGWKLQDVGLTVGEWRVTAKVTLGSQVKTADDALPLVVAQ